MHLVSIPPLLGFVAKYPDSRQSVLAWVAEVKKASWKSPANIKAQYTTASILKNRRVVFNIKGNDYRLVVSADFEKGIVWIKWLGTHKAYDRIDVKEIEHGN